jgi:alpha-glucosidase
MGNTKDNNWWRGAVFYQIYPRSFMDSNGDGIGDLYGITTKLEYVAELGVDAIWISPFYKSPMADFGYDVSDYRDVDPIFGVNEDFDLLLQKAHELGLKVIIDMVLSHTSNKHPWFVESRTGFENSRADWYVWVDPKPDGSPPNNWQSVFGGPSWTFDTRRGQYYMHNFLKEQPDLNYHNPEVQKAALANCRYWLERGVDGFRFDTINFLFHNKELKDNPARGSVDCAITQFEKKSPHNMQVHKNDISQPENLEFIKQIRGLMNEFPGTMTLGEVGDEEPYKTTAQYSDSNIYLDTCYNTHFMSGQAKKFTPDVIRKPIEEFLSQPFDSWPSWAFTNHDVVRAVTRWGRLQNYERNPNFAKLLISILCSLRGTAFIYQGDELGLPEADVPFEKLQDPWGKYLWPEWQGRDGCRTPMPWHGDRAHGAFSNTETWLPIPEEHYELAVDRQEHYQDSVLNFTRRFLQWRKKHPVMVSGDIDFIDCDDPDILMFLRKDDKDRIICIFNLTDQEKTIEYTASHDNSNFDAGKLTGSSGEQGALCLPAFGVYIGYSFD